MPLRKQIVFTEQEWDQFRRNLCENFYRQAQRSFRLVDRETEEEITSRLSDYCYGVMSQIVDSAAK